MVLERPEVMSAGSRSDGAGGVCPSQCRSYPLHWSCWEYWEYWERGSKAGLKNLKRGSTAAMADEPSPSHNPGRERSFGRCLLVSPFPYKGWTHVEGAVANSPGALHLLLVGRGLGFTSN